MVRDCARILWKFLVRMTSTLDLTGRISHLLFPGGREHQDFKSRMTVPKPRNIVLFVHGSCLRRRSMETTWRASETPDCFSDARAVDVRILECVSCSQLSHWWWSKCKTPGTLLCRMERLAGRRIMAMSHHCRIFIPNHCEQLQRLNLQSRKESRATKCWFKIILRTHEDGDTRTGQSYRPTPADDDCIVEIVWRFLSKQTTQRFLEWTFSRPWTNSETRKVLSFMSRKMSMKRHVYQFVAVHFKDHTMEREETS